MHYRICQALVLALAATAAHASNEKQDCTIEIDFTREWYVTRKTAAELGFYNNTGQQVFTDSSVSSSVLNFTVGHILHCTLLIA